MEKIEIKDLTKLKITKVTSWKVYFDYEEEQHYMLIDDSDEDAHLSLYKRDIDNGKVTLTWMNGKVTTLRISSIIKDISKRRPTSIVYANIDREHFVKKLLELEFSSGIFEDEYNRNKEQVKMIREQIEQLNKKVSELQNGWKSTSGHGSKCYRIDAKHRAANRITPAKNGEWCELYKDYYGNTDPKYGGTLTDLFSLPVGYSFYVTNGCYEATIIVDEHGDKCISTCKTCIKLTEDYHSLYIK